MQRTYRLNATGNWQAEARAHFDVLHQAALRSDPGVRMEVRAELASEVTWTRSFCLWCGGGGGVVVQVRVGPGGMQVEVVNTNVLASKAGWLSLLVGLVVAFVVATQTRARSAALLAGGAAAVATLLLATGLSRRIQLGGVAMRDVFERQCANVERELGAHLNADAKVP